MVADNHQLITMADKILQLLDFLIIPIPQAPVIVVDNQQRLSSLGFQQFIWLFIGICISFGHCGCSHFIE